MRTRSISLWLVFAVLFLSGCDQPPLPPALQAQHDAEEAAQALRVLNESGTFFFDPETQACWLYYREGYAGSITPVVCATARRRMAPHTLEMLENTEKRLGHEIP